VSGFSSGFGRQVSGVGLQVNQNPKLETFLNNFHRRDAEFAEIKIFLDPEFFTLRLCVFAGKTPSFLCDPATVMPAEKRSAK